MNAVIALAAALAIGDPATADDSTATTLSRCLEDSANAATSGQTQCEAAAREGYDGRMNRAYAALLKSLPPPTAQQLRDAQRAWLVFRDQDARARSGLFETRRGTMFVPMEAADETRVIRDRALQLEAYLRALRIDP